MTESHKFYRQIQSDSQAIITGYLSEANNRRGYIWLYSPILLVGRGKLDHCGPRQSVGRLIFGCPSSSLPVVFAITIAPLGGVAIGYILVSISSFWVMTVTKIIFWSLGRAQRGLIGWFWDLRSGISARRRHAFFSNNSVNLSRNFVDQKSLYSVSGLQNGSRSTSESFRKSPFCFLKIS